MRRLLGIVAAGAAVLLLPSPALAAGSASIAALQVALRAHGQYPAAVDGIDGPLTRAGLAGFQVRLGLPRSGRIGRTTRVKLGPLGRPLLGQRELGIGAVGWDVSSLEFKLIPFGLDPAAVDGRFTAETAKALSALQQSHGLSADGIAGKRTYRALGGKKTGGVGAFTPPVRVTHVVRAGESFFSIAQQYRVSPLLLAQASGLALATVIVPGQTLTLPPGAVVPNSGLFQGDAGPVSPDAVRASIDHWSASYGVDSQLARATAWMESGCQANVVSNVGAVGVMQLLPRTWEWVDQFLLGTVTPRTYDGNIRAGVRYLRWLLDTFAGDRRLALAGYYQGAQAVKDRGLFDDTERYVTIILRLVGQV
jgi:peptidoglycan hydrolase-like protein with peptidoglycan-binding domain